MQIVKHVAGALLGLGLAVSAQAAVVTVTPGDLNGWEANVRPNATVGITSAYPSNGSGSLEFTTNTLVSGLDKADYVNTWGVVAGRTLGNLSGLGYDYLRDASSNGLAAHLAPSLRLQYLTAQGLAGLLIYEPVYNGVSVVPTNTFISANVINANFWQRAFRPGRTIEKFDVTLAQWAAGASFPDAHVLGADTNIIGIEVGVGSGWGGQFRGAADNVLIAFGNDQRTFNFETAAVAVPEPASALLLASGLLALGMVRRRKA